MPYSLTIRTLALAAGLALLLALTPCRAQWLLQGDASRSGMTDKIGSGEIDWGSGFYYASGEGVVPPPEEEPNRARALLKARGYAKMKAVADLRMAIDGTTISYRASGRDCMAKDTTLRQTIEGYVSNVEVVGERQQVQAGDTIVIVTVRAPMYGRGGIGYSMLKSRAGKELTAAQPGDVGIERRGDQKASTVQPSAKGPFTSLIVDCLNLGVQRAVSPKIRRADGSEVWGAVGVDPDTLQERGIVAYASSVDEARRAPLAGTNPLVITAAGRAGGRFWCDAVISDPDAERVLHENQVSHFLDKCNVIFVVDAQ